MEKRDIFYSGLRALVILMTLIVFIPAAMGSETSKRESKNWEFNLAPFYLWGVGIDGDVTAGTNTVPV